MKVPGSTFMLNQFSFSKLPFDGRVEKIDSVVASFLGSALTIKLRLEAPIAFDSRLIALQKEEILSIFTGGNWKPGETLSRPGDIMPSETKARRKMKLQNI